MVDRKFWCRAAAATSVALFAAALPPQGTWSHTPTHGNPALLTRHAAAYDLVRLRMVMFGGHGANNVAQHTTWEFDGVTFAPMLLPTSPPARVGAAMAHDVQRGVVVLFGGTPTNSAAGFQNDTWEYDGASWVHRALPSAPPGRVDHAMCFDVVRACCVLFGGRRPTALGDTWTYDGVRWQQQAVPGPVARYDAALAYELTRDRALLFGGFDGVSPCGDTWEWDGASWQQRLAAGGPSPRSAHAMAHDLSRSVTVLHGGVPGGAETWEWDGAAWTQHGPTALPIFDHTLAFDARLGRTTLFGGRTPTSPATVLGAVETYGHAVPASYAPFGSSCPGSTSTAHLQAPPLSAGPLMGQTEVLRAVGAWQRAFFVFGRSDSWDGGTSLPLDLAAFGMPGCALRVSRDAITSAFAQNGVVSVSVSVPPDPFLVGVRFFVQAFALDPAANPGGFTATNGLAAIIGRN